MQDKNTGGNTLGCIQTGPRRANAVRFTQRLWMSLQWEQSQPAREILLTALAILPHSLGELGRCDSGMHQSYRKKTRKKKRLSEHMRCFRYSSGVRTALQGSWNSPPTECGFPMERRRGEPPARPWAVSDPLHQVIPLQLKPWPWASEGEAGTNDSSELASLHRALISSLSTGQKGQRHKINCLLWQREKSFLPSDPGTV